MVSRVQSSYSSVASIVALSGVGIVVVLFEPDGKDLVRDRSLRVEVARRQIEDVRQLGSLVIRTQVPNAAQPIRG